MLRRIAALLAGLALACVPRAHAATVVVPDDFPTVQQAVDTPAETVLVRSGEYPERVTVHRPYIGRTVIAGHPENPVGMRPRIGALTLNVIEPQLIRGLHVTGGLFMHNPEGNGLTFMDCALDSGAIQLSVGDTGYPGALTMVRCRIQGGVSAIIHGGHFEADTILGGGLQMDGEMGLTVRRCVFLGNGTGAAIQSPSYSGSLVVEDSRIEDYEHGVLVRSSGNDFYAEAHRNVVRRCAAVGLAIARVTGNVVEDCGTGIVASSEYGVIVRDNRVVGCRGIGIRIESEYGGVFECAGNVVGRCGEGISIWRRDDVLDVVSNTVYLNQGAGLNIDAQEYYPARIARNIAYGNGGFGLVIGEYDGWSPELRCNDWFANQRGSVHGAPLGATDLDVDPRFCQVFEDVVHLVADSPLLDVPGCGRIGAMPAGCSEPKGRHTLVATPCDPGGWSPLPGTVGAAIAGVHPHPTGSLELDGSTGLAGFRRRVEAPLPLAGLTALGIDLLRDAASTCAADHAPAVRLLVDNGKPEDRYAWLVWEPRWNGVVLAPDAWTTLDLLPGRFWQAALRADGSERVIDVHDRTLADWLRDEKVTDADGDESSTVGPDAVVLEVQIVVPAGTPGAFRGAADGLRIGAGDASSTFDFEMLRTPLVTLAGVPARMTCGTELYLDAAIVPPDAGGTIEFLDGDVSLGTVAVDGGRARLRTPAFGPGSHVLRARHSGGACLAAATSQAVPVEATPFATRIVTSLPNAVAVGGSATLRAQVIPAPIGGEVEFADASGALGRAAVWGGWATLTIDAGPVSVRPITARFLGHGCHLPSEAGAALHVVEALPSLSVNDTAVVESDGPERALTFTVSLSEPVAHEVRVTCATDGGTANPAADYWPASHSLVFTPGTTRLTFTVQVLGDLANEGDEYLLARLTNADGAAIADSAGRGTILDEDLPTLTAQTMRVAEGTGGVTRVELLVRLPGVTRDPVVVSYQTLDAGARATEGDYVAARGTFTFGALETARTIPLEVLADSAFEETEAFRVNLEAQVDGTIQGQSVMITIIDDDPTPGIFVDDAAGTEPATPGHQRFRVWLSNPSGIGTVRVTYTTQEGSAKTGADFVAATGYCQIPRYGREAFFDVPIAGDRACEPTETYTVKLSGAFNGVLRDDVAEGVILDDDCTTPTLLALFRAEAVGPGIEVRWSFADAADVAEVALERATTADGPWTRVAGERRDEDGATVALDREAGAGTHWYRIVARDREGVVAVFGPIAATAAPVSAFGLGRIAPNPARAAVTIEYAVARESRVRLAVVDVLGREVAELADGVHAAGRHVARWTAEDERGRVPAGLYFVRYQAGGRTWTRRLVVTR